MLQGADLPATHGVPGSEFKLRNHLSPHHPMGKGVRSRGRDRKFLTQETRGILKAQARGRRSCSRRGKVWKVERGKAQSRWPGSKTEQDSREMRETGRKPGSLHHRLEQGALTGIEAPV